MEPVVDKCSQRHDLQRNDYILIMSLYIKDFSVFEHN